MASKGKTYSRECESTDYSERKRSRKETVRPFSEKGKSDKWHREKPASKE